MRTIFFRKYGYSISCIASLCLLLTGSAVLCSLSASCSRRNVQQSPNIKVQFIDSRTGWIIGPRLLQTQDGGRTWKVIRQDGDGTVYSQVLYIERQLVQFVSPNLGYMMGSEGLIQTTDGGRTWSRPFPISPGHPDTRALSIFFISTKEGWAIGKDIFHTNDSGRNWERLTRSPVNDHQPAFWFINAQHGLLTSLDGEIFLTSNGGKNWNLVHKGDTPIYNIFFVDEQHGWVVGEKGFVSRTSDAGRTWSITPTQTTAFLTSVFFIDKENGWIAGHKGTILLTQDGGVTWKQAVITGLDDPPPPLTSISFADDKHGWAVGGAGAEAFSSKPSNVILTTDDGGLTWRPSQF